MKHYVIKKLFLFLIAVAAFSCSSEISVLVKNAIDSYVEGKYLTSLFFSDQALLENPNDKEALLIAVKAHLKLEEYEEADKKLNKLISLSEDPELLFIKSQINIGLQDYETALLYLDNYLNQDIKNKNEFAYFNIAYCYYQLGDYDSALRYYLKYSSMNQQNKEAYLNIAYLFGYLGNSDSAIAYYDKVLVIDSANYNALYNRSIEYQIQKKYRCAADDLELLNQFYPNNFDVLMDLAKIRIKEKKYFNAINELTRAIQIDSSNAEAYFLRGQCFIELARTHSACVDFQKAGELGYFEAYEMIKIYCNKKDKKSNQK
jgi:tetratricopeptide (TPR) repeat protein